MSVIKCVGINCIIVLPFVDYKEAISNELQTIGANDVILKWYATLFCLLIILFIDSNKFDIHF